jgi:tetratricopeptide (TPR) repeat protein
MMSMRFSLACVLALAPVSSAWDVVQESIPKVWLAAFEPEKLPPLTYPAYFNELDKARLQLERGRYRMALHSAHAAEQVDAIEAAAIRAQALINLGRYAQAAQALSDPRLADTPQAQVLRALALRGKGELRSAREALEAHLRQHPDSIQGRFELGAVCEEMGQLDAARAAFAWFVEEPQDFLGQWQTIRRGGMLPAGSPLDNAANVTRIASGIDRWATLTGAYQKLPQLHDVLIGMFVRAYDVIDREYWPARLAAAQYFLERDDTAKALEELEIVLKFNPNSIPGNDLFGRIMLDRFDFDATERAIAAIRRVNRGSVHADLLEARNLLRQRRPEDAAGPIARVLDRQPENLQALGLLAASQSLRLRDDEARRTLARVEQIAPNDASAYFEVAEQLGAMRQYPRAAEMYQIAIDRAPWWTAPRNGLGLLYTQSGDDDLALAVLDAAHELDPFNLRTTNYLRLLDELAGYDRRETDHFVIVYRRSIDPILGELFAEYLEMIHPEIVEAFDHAPDVKTTIEVYPTHDAFSVRTTGSPWIGTVGASTGRVIAMVAPRAGRQTMGTYNWASVLRHEYTHTVTLSATENRIPHWMTEGLAVVEERSPLKWDWIPMLYHAVANDELFSIEGLTWGFVRPRRPIDRQLAYAQSYWVCTYIIERFGRDKILDMMALAREGHTEQELFTQGLGISRSQFNEDFRRWAAEQVASWGYDAETTERYEQLRERGEALIKARQFDRAIEIWQELAEIRPVDALPHQRLAGLYLIPQVNQPGKAIEHLVRLHEVELKDNRFAKRIARLYRDLGELERAVEFAMQAIYVSPYDLDAHKLLAELHEARQDAPALEIQRARIAAIQKMGKEQ